LDSTIASRVMKIQQAKMSTNKKETQTSVAAPISQEPMKQKPPMAPMPDALSPREMEVLGLLVDGLSNQEIADRLIISLATAKTHVRNILNKLAVDDRTQAAVHAMRRGLV